MIDTAKKSWIDITVPVRDAMVHWPSDPPVSDLPPKRLPLFKLEPPII